MSRRHGAGQLGLGWATHLGESMIQLLRAGVEAPRLLKRSLSRLICCWLWIVCCCCVLLLFRTRVNVAQNLCRCPVLGEDLENPPQRRRTAPPHFTDGSLSRRRRHTTDESSEQPEGHPSSDSSPCPCRPLADSKLHGVVVVVVVVWDTA